MPPLPIAETLSGLKTILRDVTDVIGIIKTNADSAFSLGKLIQTKRAIYQLDEVLRYLNYMSRMQGGLSGLLYQHAAFIDKYHKSRRVNSKIASDSFGVNDSLIIASKEFILDTVFSIQDKIILLNAIMDSTHNFLLHINPVIYDNIISSLFDRDRLFKDIIRVIDVDSQFQPNDSKLLRNIADEYELLRSTLQDYRKALAQVVVAMDGEKL